MWKESVYFEVKLYFLDRKFQQCTWCHTGTIVQNTLDVLRKGVDFGQDLFERSLVGQIDRQEIDLDVLGSIFHGRLILM